MEEDITIQFNQSQRKTLVQAASLLCHNLGHNRSMSMNVAVEMICMNFISRYSKPEDMTNIVEFPRQEQKLQPTNK